MAETASAVWQIHIVLWRVNSNIFYLKLKVVKCCKMRLFQWFSKKLFCYIFLKSLDFFFCYVFFASTFLLASESLLLQSFIVRRRFYHA